MRWKLRAFLLRHGLNAHQVVIASGLSTRTIYPIAAGESTRVDLHSLEAIIAALRDLTGERVDMNDLLEFEGAVVAPDLDVLIGNASRSAVILEPTGAKPRGARISSVGSAADAVVQERDERERNL